jgi:hypothetical protein
VLLKGNDNNIFVNEFCVLAMFQPVRSPAENARIFNMLGRSPESGSPPSTASAKVDNDNVEDDKVEVEEYDADHDDMSDDHGDGESELIIETRTIVRNPRKDVGWCPDLTTIQGTELATLSVKSSRLANLIGLKHWKEFKKYDGIKYIRCARDDMVDARISEYHLDTFGTTIEKINVRHREKAFVAANVPGLLEICLLGGPTITIASSARKGKNPQVCLSAELIQWLREAKSLKLDVPISHVYSAWNNEDLPILPTPLKYRKRGDTVAIFRDYMDRNQKTKTIQHSLCKASKLHLMQDVIDQTIADLVYDINVEIKSNTDD